MAALGGLSPQLKFPFGLLGYYQPLARQPFVLFFHKIGPAVSDLVAFSRVGAEFLRSRRQPSRPDDFSIRSTC